jgi:hypothetical protein
MGHAAPNSLGGCLFRLLPRRPGSRPGLFGAGPSAACSAEATGWWLPVLAGPAAGAAGGWCRLTEPSHSCWEASHARRAWASSKSTRAVRGSSGSASCTQAASIAEATSRSAHSPQCGGADRATPKRRASGRRDSCTGRRGFDHHHGLPDRRLRRSVGVGQRIGRDHRQVAR